MNKLLLFFLVCFFWLVATEAKLPSPQGSFAGLKVGMFDFQIVDYLGTPKEVEGVGEYEIWTYTDGTLLVRKGNLVTWSSNKKKGSTSPVTPPQIDRTRVDVSTAC